MNNGQKEKGITLIALAVTIIVMLILAGVTMAALTSENGIIKQADKVKETNKVAKVEEEAKLEYSNLIIEKQMEGHGEETNLDDVIGKLEAQGYETAKKDEKSYIKIGEYYYEIKLENQEVSIAKEKTEGITGGNSGKDKKVTVAGKTLSIPSTAVVSQFPGEYESIDNGIVIYIMKDADGNIDTPDWTNKEYMQKTYDQFVWVPVENAVLDLSSTYSSLDDAGIRAKVQEQINAGKYPMAIKTGTKTDNKDDYIGVLYEFSEENNAVKVTPNSKWTPKSTSYREPSALAYSGYDNNSSNLQQINGILGTTYSDATSFGTELQRQFNAMVEKVSQAGGFWIGRYETSNMQDSTTKTQVSTRRGTITRISRVTWYRMYAQQSLYSKLAIGNDQTSKTSSMIWGSQYDQVMIWMKNVVNDKENTRGKYYVTNGVVKGNYGTITINGSKVDDGNSSTSAPAQIGSQDAYVVKNIFDLAGNVLEWTLEADYTFTRVGRGGSYSYANANDTRPGSRDSLDPLRGAPRIGSRLTLY